MRELSDIRGDINKVDEQLKKLFLERMELVDQVKEYKEQTNIPVKNKSREAEILKSKLEGVERFRPETEEFFKSMIEISCNYQDQNLSNKGLENNFNITDDVDLFSKVKSVCHQGIEGSYSYETAVKYFSDKEIISVSTFREVFENVKSGKCDVGILPLENLSMGCVTDVYDLLTEYDVYITHCCGLEITHCLAGVGEKDNVRKVISHPQALGQCNNFLEDKGYDKQDWDNTACAAKYVYDSNDASLAAICSKECAKTYSLKIFEENISDIKNNVTKFVFIAKSPVVVKDADKISIIFTVKHESGTLSRVLNDFAKKDINLTKIESRPSKDNDWKYVFYVDLLLPDFDIIEYFSKIRYMFEDFKISGIYKNLE